MLIATALIALTAFALPERPAGSLALVNLLPGLTLIEPGWWSRILHAPVSDLEGAFWSLYVEMKFYVLAGSVYFLLGRRWVIPFLVACFLIAVFPPFLGWPDQHTLVAKVVQGAARELSWVHFIWFAAGSCFYEFYQGKRWPYFIFGLIFAAVGACIPWVNYSHALAAWLVSILFAATLIFERVRQVFASKIIVFFGFISYPLYLMHENAMVALTVKLARFWPQLSPSLAPLLALLPIIVIAWLVAKFGEPQLRDLIGKIRNV